MHTRVPCRIASRFTAFAPSSRKRHSALGLCTFPFSTAAYIRARRTSFAQHTHSTCNNVRVVAPCTFPTTMHVTATNCLPIGNPIVQLQLRQQYYECCASANGRAIITLHRTDHILRLRQVSVTTVEVALRCQVTQRGRFCRFVCCHVVRCELCGFVGDAGHGLRKRKKRDKLGSESHLGLKS
jgi:hypothetical protein